MTTTDPRVDAYIEKSAPFAQPILKHLRQVVHQASPDIEEGVRWGMPHFFHKGMLCGTAAFTKHCAFGFWRGSLIVKDHPKAREAMGSFGRIASLADLPPKKQIIGYVRQAMKLNEEGVSRHGSGPTRARRARPAPRTPADLAKALRSNAKAKAVWQKATPSFKRDYVEWLTEAKTPETRARRLASAIAWIAAGKQRHWKYMRKKKVALLRH